MVSTVNSHLPISRIYQKLTSSTLQNLVPAGIGDKSHGTGDTTTEVAPKTAQEAGQTGVMAETVAQMVKVAVQGMAAVVVTVVETVAVGEKATNPEMAGITMATTARGHMVVKVAMDGQTDPPMVAPMVGQMVEMAETTIPEERVVEKVATTAAQKGGRTVARNPTPTPTKGRVEVVANPKGKAGRACLAEEIHSVTSIRRRRRITHETEFFFF